MPRWNSLEVIFQDFSIQRIESMITPSKSNPSNLGVIGKYDLREDDCKILTGLKAKARKRAINWHQSKKRLLAHDLDIDNGFLRRCLPQYKDSLLVRSQKECVVSC